MGKELVCKTILFVEDVFSPIKEVWDDILELETDWWPVLRENVPAAWKYLCNKKVDAAVIDIMLPALEGVAPKSEGLFLAACILGKADPSSAGLHSRLHPDNSSVAVCLLTARTRLLLRQECKALQVADIQIFQKHQADASSHHIRDWLRKCLRS